MKKILIGLAVLVVVAVGGILALRSYAARKADEGLFSPRALGAARPEAIGLPHETITIASGDRRLHGWFVPAMDTASVSTGVLIFHGNRASIAEQIGLQKALYEHGVSSLVFDYSGYGASTGRPSVRAVREDALSAFDAFSRRMPPSSRKFLLGTSLGAAIMLDALDEMQDTVDGVIVIGTFASSVETAVRRGRVPRPLAFLLDDPYDNVRAASALSKPLLVIHSPQDEVFPFADAERIAAAAQGPRQLVRAEAAAHDTYLAAPRDWLPVIAFLRETPLAPGP